MVNQLWLRMTVMVLSACTMVMAAVAVDKVKLGKAKVSLNSQQLADWAAGKGLKTATFGTGCFWCTEACFVQLNGVEKVVSGYSGGHVKNPTYEQVSAKRTGHAEVVQVYYDPNVVTYDKLLESFFFIHDPTSKNRQGADVGPQYRSVIFYHDDEQKAKAELAIAKLDEAKVYNKKIVTEVTAFEEFYPAEDYHQNYLNLNPGNPYCQSVVIPKVQKFRKVFKDELQSSAK